MTQAPSLTQRQLREQLFDAVVGELLGPAQGENEEFPARAPRPGARYILGQLAPPGTAVDQSQNDKSESEEGGGNEEGTTDAEVPPKASFIPSAIGMTFGVDAAATEVAITATWGQYLRVESESEETEAGNPATVWRRYPRGGSTPLTLTDGPLELENIDAVVPGVLVRGKARRAVSGHWIVSLFLENKQEKPAHNEDEGWLFQPSLKVEGVFGEAAIVSRDQVVDSALGNFADGGAWDERATMDMIYRGLREFAVGHGVAVHADVAPGRPDRATSVETRVVPMYDLRETESRSADDDPSLADVVLDMRALSEMPADELSASLTSLMASYEAWIDRNEARANTPELGDHRTTALDSVEKCRKALRRARAGVSVLASDPNALDAFRFANQAMSLQRVRSELVRAKREDPSVTIDAVDVPKNRRWYPFQLAFLLLVLPSLADPRHVERTDPAQALADLLWFPTGGGKTEAYLGAAAFAMAIRRLQGDLGDYEGERGIAVIMRYTLRLLTIQQFQRAAALLCGMEVIRRERVLGGDNSLGQTPFRIGLWVGNSATPNRFKEAKQSITAARGGTWAGAGVSSPQQLTACPWCGSEIKEGRDLESDDVTWRTLTFCSDVLGECPFSRREAAREGLPIVVVDEEIYRLLPSMIVGTVDKFAQMPWRGEVQTLFGRVDGYCERHGFISQGSCGGEHAPHSATKLAPKKGRTRVIPRAASTPADSDALAYLERTVRQEAGPLRPPDLIIQDELHLITGPLGTMVGLYETAVDDLCKWTIQGATVMPKIIASTATIRNARKQVHGLFVRDVDVFPPSGLDHDDGYFALLRPLSETHPGRRYLGICAPGKSRPSVLIRVYVAFLTAAQNLFNTHGVTADPWTTLVGYFNSLRELGGMRRLVDDDVRTRAFRIDKYGVNRPGLSPRNISRIEELTSRMGSADIPRVLADLERPFAMPAGASKQRQAGPRSYDVMLATNMLSVGVDVRRLGLMVVNGQPKTTSEYIQATSRVGRASPGLVAAVFNWARPRDLSHYESFEHYHATFYRHIEPLSVTPFSARAVDRGLSGVLSSMVRLHSLDYSSNPDARLIERSLPDVGAIERSVAERAHSVTSDPQAKTRVEASVNERMDFWAHEAKVSDRVLGYRTDNKTPPTIGLLHAATGDKREPFTVLNSLRDVEPQVRLILPSASGGSVALPEWGPPSSVATSGEGEAQ